MFAPYLMMITMPPTTITRRIIRRAIKIYTHTLDASSAKINNLYISTQRDLFGYLSQLAKFKITL